MVNQALNMEIVADIKRIAEKLGVSRLSRSEYLQYGNYSAERLSEKRYDAVK
jgi:hypothetical protein